MYKGYSSLSPCELSIVWPVANTVSSVAYKIVKGLIDWLVRPNKPLKNAGLVFDEFVTFFSIILSVFL